ncbi:MAG: WD40 repeat domain-containing protein [Bacteroidetes bacterium]|nr:MAG: WD40 repeat domain-containing protein [Bacteroidota bacterium]
MQTSIHPILPDDQNHLSQLEVMRYAQARAKGMEPLLTTEQEEHLATCPHCQQAIMEAFNVLADSPLAEVPTISELQNTERKSLIVTMTRRAMRVAVVLLLGFSLLTAYWILSTPQASLVRKWQSPFENKKIDVGYQDWKIQGSEAKTLYLPNGTYVKIPAGVFVNNQGEEARGNITVQYREMRSLSDLLASGVPTQYDSLGIKHTLATLGMFEIRAWQDDKPLHLAPNKVLEVNMLTADISKDYSHYFLQEGNQMMYNTPLATPAHAQSQDAKWQYLGASPIMAESLPTNLSPMALLESKQRELESLEQNLKQMQERPENVATISARELPQETNKLFSLKLNEEQHPGLARYHNTIWEYVGENPEHNPAGKQDWVLQEKWDEVKLKNEPYRSLSLIGHTAPVRSAVFSPDGNTILTASDDHTARLWTKDAQFLSTLQGHSASVNMAVYSPDGQHILTASNDRTAIVWSRQGDRLFTLRGHTASVKNASYSPNGQYILTTSEDNTVKLWSAKGEFLFSLKHYVPHFEAQFSPDSKTILTIPDESSAEIWAVTGAKVRAIEGFFGTARFSISGDYIITTSRNPNSSKAIVWATTGKKLRELTDITDGQAMFTPDEGHIFSYAEATPRLWHWNKNKPNSTVLIRNMRNNPNEKREGHTQKIRQTAFAKNGTWIMTAGADHVARIWSNTGNLVRTLREHTAPVNSVQASQDGSMWVTASDDNTAKIWKERETKDVFELVLIKNNKILIDEKQRRYEIKGKEFHVPVRIKGEQTVSDSPNQLVVTAQKDVETTENTVLERYEKVLAECNALQQMPQKSQGQLAFRQFKVRNLGVYACAKAVQNNTSETYTLKLEKSTQEKSLQVYRVGQIGSAYLLQELKKQNEVSLSRKEMLVVIFPQDRLALYQPETIKKDCAPPAKVCKLNLQPQAKVFAKEDLDRVMR